jgi:hypothetical protein
MRQVETDGSCRTSVLDPARRASHHQNPNGWLLVRPCGLGGHLKMAIAERREAVKELAAGGYSNVAIGSILEPDVEIHKSRFDDAGRVCDFFTKAFQTPH